MKQSAIPQAIELADYRPPPYRTRTVELDFNLEPSATRVSATMWIERAGDAGAPLELFGDGIGLDAIALDGRPLADDAYSLEGDRLSLADPGAQFALKITNTIDPAANAALSGLYLTNGLFCTQCEAEGFRRITWFQDRPDVLATYKVRIEADKARYPVLLSNGNLLETGDLGGGRHFAVWHDPFPKPAYLFALVAGDLALLEDGFTTGSGRKVALRIYSEAENISQCGHAMQSLKKSMAWDEAVYGLEYDLDLYQIVAVNDFNMGAMENKGLNVFNTSATLASPATATDADFMSVERIIAHEYFHNWTGNRVTCRDWFQLTLKEGLTVFRDQQFSADMHSAAVKRINDVAQLREGQFVEDSGPLAHPIRPESYIEINNFYTRTVYDKGAEVIRMIHTLIGAEAFRAGIDLYFARHDGQAVTCEDFVAAMADASGKDLSQFMRWYHQAGTPTLTVEREFDRDRGQLTLRLSQATPPTPGQADKLPVHLPVRMGLIGADTGNALPLQLAGENAPRGTERVLELKDAEQEFTFVGLAEPPVPSLLRGFSAPVRLDIALSRDEQAMLLAHDGDLFGRWEAGQSLALDVLHEMLTLYQAGRRPIVDPRLIEAIGAVVENDALDPAFVARAAALPTRSYFAQKLPVIDVEGIAAVHLQLRQTVGRQLAAAWQAAYQRHHHDGGFADDSAAMASRALKNTSLAYMMAGGVDGAVELATAQYDSATNMTDQLAALRVIAVQQADGYQRLLERFYEQWQHEALVVNKWFALQAMIEDDRSLERVLELTRHKAFSMTNPNRLRSLVSVFVTSNLEGFHRRDGAGYRFLREIALDLDRRNPQIASRLVSALGRWRRYDEVRKSRMRGELEAILATDGLSRDSFEIASKSLADG